MIALKVFTVIGIVAVMAGLQHGENKARGVETPPAGLVGWLKFGFLVYLLWFWVSSWVPA